MEFSQPSLPLPSLWQEYLCTQKASKVLYKQGSTDQPNTITNALPPTNMCTHAHAHPGHAMGIQLVNEPQGKRIESQCLLLGRLDFVNMAGMPQDCCEARGHKKTTVFFAMSYM